MNKTHWMAIVGGLAMSLCASAQDMGLIEDQYIVRLHAPMVGDLPDTVDALLGTNPGSQLLHTYDTVLFGFAARMSAAQAEALTLNPLVHVVEQDRVVQATGVQTGATWGIDRVDQDDLPLDGSYAYPDGAGSGVHIYVLDTGINPDHVEFAGRIGTSINFVAPTPFSAAPPGDWQDCHGHGTHVSSTAAGTTWGVAKHATIHAVRVLGCLSNGSASGVIAGMEWVADNAEYPAVANLSLGTVTGRSIAQEDATQGMYDAGVLPVVAAGNDSKDACTVSPAALPDALTIGASDQQDRQSSFSNHGTCVDLFAPGSSITAARHSSNTASTSMSGTSMASPHVAGAAAIKLSLQPSLTPADLTQALLLDATAGTLSDVSANTPNALLYVSDDGTVTPIDHPPVAAFSASCSGLDCSFDAAASSDDQAIASYAWSFGDGSAGQGALVSQQYAAAGSYSVVLTVTDSAGQADTASQTVVVSDGSGPGGDPDYTGELANGASATHPDAGFEFSGGVLEAQLYGPETANFDLHLQVYSCFLWCAWSDVASATTSSSDEQISTTVGAGTYRWRVESVSGAGEYALYADH